MATLCIDCKNRSTCAGVNIVCVRECTGYKKEEKKEMSKGFETFKGIMKAIGEGLAEGAAAYEARQPEINLKTDVTLGVEELRQLRDMMGYQLEKIFRNKTVHLSDDPAVYRELCGFTSYQLEAIFGKEEKKED